MPSLNFQPRFADDVEHLVKRCSIRAKRKNPIRVGGMLYLFTGMRSKACRRLRQARCLNVTPILIDGVRVFLRGEELTAAQIAGLARDDGFKTLEDFWAFFHRRSGPFEGDLIEW